MRVDGTAPMDPAFQSPGPTAQARHEAHDLVVKFQQAADEFLRADHRFDEHPHDAGAKERYNQAKSNFESAHDDLQRFVHDPVNRFSTNVRSHVDNLVNMKLHSTDRIAVYENVLNSINSDR